jgi:hypothetical protein
MNAPPLDSLNGPATRPSRRPRRRGLTASISVAALLILLLLAGRSVAQNDRRAEAGGGGAPSGPGGDPLGPPDFDPLFADPAMTEAWIEQLRAEEWPQGPRRRQYPWLDEDPGDVDPRRLSSFVASLVERHQKLEKRREKVRDAAFALREEFEAARSGESLLSERGLLRQLARQRASLHRDTEEVHREERELMMDGAVARVYIDKLEQVLGDAVKLAALPPEDLGEAQAALDVLEVLRDSPEVSRALRIAFEDSALGPGGGGDGRPRPDDEGGRANRRGPEQAEPGPGRDAWPGGPRSDRRAGFGRPGEGRGEQARREGENPGRDEQDTGGRPGERLVGERLGEAFRGRMNVADQIQDRMQDMARELRELREEVRMLREEVATLRREFGGPPEGMPGGASPSMSPPPQGGAREGGQRIGPGGEGRIHGMPPMGGEPGRGGPHGPPNGGGGGPDHPPQRDPRGGNELVRDQPPGR